jgi:hypothetical protein
VKPSVADGYGTVGRSAAATSIQFHRKKPQNNMNTYVFFIDQIRQQNKNWQSSI